MYLKFKVAIIGHVGAAIILNCYEKNSSKDTNQFPVESISGSNQIAFFINLRTDLKDQGWWTGSMWSLPSDLFQAGWSITHFRASYILILKNKNIDYDNSRAKQSLAIIFH